MRFETSQTTPSYLDRRLQLRMLSFVGLISLIMVTLSLVNHRPKSESELVNQQAMVSPDSLTYEVHREEPSLKPGEVIIAPGRDDDGPRGQWSETSSRDRGRDDVAVQDRELFKPRKQERSRDDRFFTRRTIAPQNADSPRVDEFSQPTRTEFAQPARTEFTQPNRAAQFDDDLNDNRIVRPRVSNRAEAGPVLGPVTPLDDDPTPIQNPTNLPSFDDDLREPVRREPPSFADQPPRGDPLDLPSRRPLDLPVRNPDQPDRNRNQPADAPSPYRMNFPDEQSLEDGPVRNRVPQGRRYPGPDAGDDYEIGRGRRDAQPLPEPVDLRRPDDNWRTRNSNSEPFRDDFSSVRIDKRYLDLVKDNTLGVRSDESEAYFWLLDHARRVAPSVLERAGDRDVQYVNLMTEPDRYRGELVTIEGDLWRLYEIDANRNDYGVSRMYEGWVFTGDSGNHPYRIVCTNLANGIEPGENLRKPVRITGYFFKREGYRSNGGVHVAPTLLANRIGINPMPNGIPLTAGIVPYMIGAIMAVGLALLVTVVGFAIGDERSARAGSQRLRTHAHLSFADLPVPALVPVEESLRQYAERQREASVSGAYGPLLNRQTAKQHAVHDQATSHQLTIDLERRQHQRQTDVLQDWANRQKSAEFEAEAYRTGNDLDSDKLAPARNFVSRSMPVIHVPPAIIPPPVPVQSFAYGTTNIASVPAPANISYGASKLSEWEDEVSKLNSRVGSRQFTNHIGVSPVGATSAELSAVDQIERDREAREAQVRDRLQWQQAEAERQRLQQLERDRIEHERVTREQEIRDRLHRQQVENERLRLQQLERDRLEHERLQRERELHEHRERDRLKQEQHERDRLAQERHSASRHDEPATVFSLSSPTAERLELERLERERLEREHHERERLEQERYEHERLLHERAAADRANRDHANHSHSSSNELHQYEDEGESDYQERLRLDRERHEHEHARIHREYDRHGDDADSDSDQQGASEHTDVSADSTKNSAKRRGGWGWPRRSKKAEAGQDLVDDSADSGSNESVGDADANSRSSGKGWGNGRKRRRNWRTGESV